MRNERADPLMAGGRWLARSAQAREFLREALLTMGWARGGYRLALTIHADPVVSRWPVDLALDPVSMAQRVELWDVAYGRDNARR